MDLRVHRKLAIDDIGSDDEEENAWGSFRAAVSNRDKEGEGDHLDPLNPLNQREEKAFLWATLKDTAWDNAHDALLGQQSGIQVKSDEEVRKELASLVSEDRVRIEGPMMELL